MTDSINVVSSDVSEIASEKSANQTPMSKYALKKLARLASNEAPKPEKGATVKHFSRRVQPQTVNTVKMYEVNGKVIIDCQGRRQSIEVRGKLVSQTGKVDAFFLNTEAKALVEKAVNAALRGKKFTILNGERSLHYKLIDLEKKDETPTLPPAA